MELMRLDAAYKDYLWGGTNLKTKYNKVTDMKIVSESWEVSTHKDGSSIIASGPNKGVSLREYVGDNKVEIVGLKASEFPFFPVLIKFIDAKDALSIQVHPNDEYALKNENSFGKTEMWYVLDAEEDAFLYYGFNREISKEEMAERIANNSLLEVLKKVKVKKGDVAFIEAGTIHAIGAGLTICEIQQNSNLTYRVYDYNRLGVDGKSRPLHVEKSLEVTNLKPSKYGVENTNLKVEEGYSKGCMASCQYFTCDLVKIKDSYCEVVDDQTFKTFTCVEGSGTITNGNTSFEFNKGDTFFAPCNLGEVTMEGKATIIVAYV